jgi:hypothetical protein
LLLIRIGRLLHGRPALTVGRILGNPELSVFGGQDLCAAMHEPTQNGFTRMLRVFLGRRNHRSKKFFARCRHRRQTLAEPAIKIATIDDVHIPLSVYFIPHRDRIAAVRAVNRQKVYFLKVGHSGLTPI